MLDRRSYVAIVAAAVVVGSAISPGCSSTIDSTTLSTSSGSGGASATSSAAATGGAGQAGAAGSTSASSVTTGASGGSGGGSGGASTGGGGAGGSGCALCSAAFDHNDPAPASSLCTHNAPESSKQYFDAFETCCTSNCGHICDCAQPYGILSGQCELCRGESCGAEVIACGQCDSCSGALQGTANSDKLCTAGATPSAAARWASLTQCACAACPDDCATDGCMNASFGVACLACSQTNCPTELQSCISDDMPTSG